MLLRKNSDFAKVAINLLLNCKYHSHTKKWQCVSNPIMNVNTKMITNSPPCTSKQQMSLEKTYQCPCTDLRDESLLAPFEGSLVESALALLATYYVFMYNYPPGLTHFFLFLQKCILHIQDGKKLPSSVISLVNSFHEHQSVLATCCASRSV